MKYHIFMYRKKWEREREKIQNSMDYVTKHIQFLNQCATAKVAKLSKRFLWLLHLILLITLKLPRIAYPTLYIWIFSFLLVACEAYRNKDNALNYLATGGKVFPDLILSFFIIAKHVQSFFFFLYHLHSISQGKRTQYSILRVITSFRPLQVLLIRPRIPTSI